MDEIREALGRLATAFEANNLSIPSVTVDNYRDWSALRLMILPHMVDYNPNAALISGVVIHFVPDRSR